MIGRKIEHIIGAVWFRGNFRIVYQQGGRLQPLEGLSDTLYGVLTGDKPKREEVSGNRKIIVNGVIMPELELPWVEYKKECTEEELSYLITDAADLYAAITRYEIAVKTGISPNRDLTQWYSSWLYTSIIWSVNLSL